MLDTTNIHHSHAFVAFLRHPFRAVVERLGEVRFEYVGDGAIAVIVPGIGKLGVGKSVNAALDQAMKEFGRQLDEYRRQRVPQGELFPCLGE